MVIASTSFVIILLFDNLLYHNDVCIFDYDECLKVSLKSISTSVPSIVQNPCQLQKYTKWFVDGTQKSKSNGIGRFVEKNFI